jgi:hypothetical protein
MKGTLVNRTILLIFLLCAHESSMYAENYSGLTTRAWNKKKEDAQPADSKNAAKQTPAWSTQTTFEIKPDQKNPAITTLQEVKPQIEEEPTGLRGLIRTYPVTTQIVTMAVSFGAGYYAKDLWKALYDRLPTDMKAMIPEILRVIEQMPLSTATPPASSDNTTNNNNAIPKPSAGISIGTQTNFTSISIATQTHISGTTTPTGDDYEHIT